MTAQTITPDWTVALDLDHVAKHAARIVAAKYRENAVGALAELDDLHQEARILLATKFAATARELSEGVLRFRLVRALNGKVRYRASHAADTKSLEEVGASNGAPDFARGLDGQTVWGAAW